MVGWEQKFGRVGGESTGTGIFLGEGEGYEQILYWWGRLIPPVEKTLVHEVKYLETLPQKKD